MSTELQLVPFHGNTIEAVMEEGRPWASIRSICSGLGLHLQAQHEKLRAKPWAVIRLIRTTAADGKSYETLCIDLDAQRAPERLFTAKQMCAYLQITPRRWRDLYLGGDLDSAEVRLGEGEEELRWDPGAVLSLLRARRAS